MTGRFIEVTYGGGDMHEAGEQSHTRWRRMLLLCCGISFLWLTMVLLTPSSASAADDEENAGLLGAVTSTVTSTVGEVTTVVQTTVVQVADVVETVAPAAAPVTSVVPTLVTPVTDVVATTTTRVTDAAATTTSAVVSTATDVVQGAAGVVAEVTTALPAVPVVGGAVSEVVQALPLSATLQVVADALGALSVVAGVIDVDNPVTLPATPTVPAPGAVLLPADAELASFHMLPAPVHTADAAPTAVFASVGVSTLQMSFGAQAPFVAALTLLGTAAVAISSSAVPRGIATGLWGSTGGSSGSFAGSSASSGNSGLTAALASLPVLTWAALRRRTLHDDALPGAPVFATDITPD